MRAGTTTPTESTSPACSFGPASITAASRRPSAGRLISSQFGILDTCGFRKDNSYYYQAWWTDKPLLHLLPHWNWPGKEGQEIRVWAHSNCDEVELFLNDKSLGRKTMERNSHLEWNVPYAPGTLLARGFKNGKEILSDRVETTGEPAVVKLTPHRTALHADGRDVSVITVEVLDAEGRHVPTANNEVTFNISGPGRIIGVGNGDPSSHEPDKFVEIVDSVAPEWRMLNVDGTDNRPEIAVDFDDSSWQAVFDNNDRGERRRDGNRDESEQITVYRGTFMLPPTSQYHAVSLQLRRIASEQLVYLNGRQIASDAVDEADGLGLSLELDLLREGKNVLAIIASRPAENERRRRGRIVGNPAVLKIVRPLESWKRSLFNGLAQIIVQSTDRPGEIVLTASSPKLEPASVRLETRTGSLPAIAQSSVGHVSE